MQKLKELLPLKVDNAKEDEAGYIRVYDRISPEQLVEFLHRKGLSVSEVYTDKISLEEYYIDLMKSEGNRT